MIQPWKRQKEGSQDFHVEVLESAMLNLTIFLMTMNMMSDECECHRTEDLLG